MSARCRLVLIWPRNRLNWRRGRRLVKGRITGIQSTVARAHIDRPSLTSANAREIDMVKARRDSERHAPAESPAERRAKYVYQLLLIVSLVFNGILAWRTLRNAESIGVLNEAKTRLEVEKTRLDAQVLTLKNMPVFTSSLLRYDLPTFAAQLKKGQLVPFLSSTHDFRIIDNSVFSTLEQGLKKFQRGSGGEAVVSFFMLANVGQGAAFATTAVGREGSLIQIGDVFPNGIVLIPESYGAPMEQLTRAPVFESIRFEVAGGATGRVSHEVTLPPPAAQAWVPLLQQVRGIGRATVGDDSRRIRSILPGSEKR